MPLVDITLGAGRSPEQIRDLIHQVHAAVADTVQAAPDHIRVIVREVPRDHWATGDVTLTELDARRTAGTDPHEEPR